MRGRCTHRPNSRTQHTARLHASRKHTTTTLRHSFITPGNRDNRQQTRRRRTGPPQPANFPTLGRKSCRRPSHRYARRRTGAVRQHQHLTPNVNGRTHPTGRRGSSSQRVSRRRYAPLRAPRIRQCRPTTRYLHSRYNRTGHYTVRHRYPQALVLHGRTVSQHRALQNRYHDTRPLRRTSTSRRHEQINRTTSRQDGTRANRTHRRRSTTTGRISRPPTNSRRRNMTNHMAKSRPLRLHEYSHRTTAS